MLRPLPGADPICLFHQLRSPALQDIVARLVTGGTAPQIKAADMGNLPIPVLEPSQSEQIRRGHEAVLRISRQMERLEQDRAALLMEVSKQRP